MPDPVTLDTKALEAAVSAVLSTSSLGTTRGDATTAITAYLAALPAPHSEGGTAGRREEIEAADKHFSGSWNNWIAPFHRCTFCGDSLNWQQSVDVFDRPLITASCACGVMYSARLGEEGLEQARAVDAGNKLAALCVAPAAPPRERVPEVSEETLEIARENAKRNTAAYMARFFAETCAAVEYCAAQNRRPDARMP